MALRETLSSCGRRPRPWRSARALAISRCSSGIGSRRGSKPRRNGHKGHATAEHSSIALATSPRGIEPRLPPMHSPHFSRTWRSGEPTPNTVVSTRYFRLERETCCVCSGRSPSPRKRRSYSLSGARSSPADQCGRLSSSTIDRPKSAMGRSGSARQDATRDASAVMRGASIARSARPVAPRHERTPGMGPSHVCRIKAAEVTLDRTQLASGSEVCGQTLRVTARQSRLVLARPGCGLS